MIQIYYGDGKGKTTAAIGSAVRASGNDLKVLFIQFFKDFDTPEILRLSEIKNLKCNFPKEKYVLFDNKNPETLKRLSDSYKETMRDVIKTAGEYSMIVLDESLDALNLNLFDKDEFIRFLEDYKDKLEIILTGHIICREIYDVADYITKFEMIRHPFNKGIKARKGIEY